MSDQKDLGNHKDSLAHHLIAMLNHPNVKPGSPFEVIATSNSGKETVGVIHAAFSDGIAVLSDKKITYIPFSGLSALSFRHPVYGFE